MSDEAYQAFMEANYDDGSSYPEGLHLALTPDEQLGIFDAQDVCWIIFTDGGHGDPVRWQSSIVAATCKALGIERAFDEEGEEVTVAELVSQYTGGIIDTRN